MTIETTVETDWRSALKAGDTHKKNILSMVRAELKNKQFEVGTGSNKTLGLPDKIAIAVLRKMIKQRKEAAELMVGRPELVAKENYECIVIQNYIPAAPNAEIMAKTIDFAIAELGATSLKDMARVMTNVQDKFDGQANGKELIEMVKIQLGKPIKD